MWIAVCSLLCTLAILPNSIEADRWTIYESNTATSITHYGASYYRDVDGDLVMMLNHNFYHVARNYYFIIGIYIEENIHAIYNQEQVQIFIGVLTHDHITQIPVSYNHYFVRLEPPTPHIGSPQHSTSSSGALSSPAHSHVSSAPSSLFSQPFSHCSGSLSTYSFSTSTSHSLAASAEISRNHSPEAAPAPAQRRRSIWRRLLGGGG